MGYPHLLQLARATLAAAEPGDCEDGEQGDGNDADPDGAPQSRGQDSYAEVRRSGLPSGRAGADRRLIVAGNGVGGAVGAVTGLITTPPPPAYHGYYNYRHYGYYNHRHYASIGRRHYAARNTATAASTNAPSGY
jgi:hypothetical protein